MGEKRGPYKKKPLTPLQQEYAAWLLLDKRTRMSLGAPLNKQDWAELKGVSARQLRRWQESEVFAEFRRRLEIDQARALRGGTVQPVERLVNRDAYVQDHAVVERRYDEAGAELDVPVVSEHQRVVDESRQAGITDVAMLDYESVKEAVLSEARRGDARALELYMKHWGNRFAALEAEQGKNRFQQLSDDDLVGEVLGLVGVAAVERWLASQKVADETVTVDA